MMFTTQPADLEWFVVVVVMAFGWGTLTHFAGLSGDLPSTDVDVEIGPGVTPSSLFGRR